MLPVVPSHGGATSICVPVMYRVGCVSLGGLLPSKVINVTAWSSLCPGHAAMEQPHIFLILVSLGTPHHLHTSDWGSLGNLSILVKNCFHCTLRVSSS